MKLNQVLALTAIPVLLGTLAFTSINKTNAADTTQIMAQNQPTQGKPRRRGPDFAAAATKLGVTEQQLKDALGVPDEITPGQRPPRPDFAAAATKLGVTEQQLKDALGKPPGGHHRRPDFAAAAS